MTYEEARQLARGNVGYCHACPVCDGRGCKNTIPGPGAKGTGTVAIRNYEAWQSIYLNMDTIAPNLGTDTSTQLFGERFDLPVFAAPIGAVTNHYGDKYNEYEYTEIMARGCRQAGIAAFTGDGLNEMFFEAGCTAMEKAGFAVPTVKPWHRDLVFKKIDYAKAHGAKAICMDIDASGLPFLKAMTPPSGSKSVQELREFTEYAGIPFYLKGIMTVMGALKALDAGAAGIIVSNHGGPHPRHRRSPARHRQYRGRSDGCAGGRRHPHGIRCVQGPGAGREGRADRSALRHHGLRRTGGRSRRLCQQAQGGAVRLHGNDRLRNSGGHRQELHFP